MAETSMAASASEKYRQEGNAFYKAGKLVEAIECYRQAVETAIEDPLPFSNLSAAYYELGDYSSCADIARKALDLVTPEQGDLKKKLKLRLAKSFLHSRQYKDVEELLKKSEADVLSSEKNDLIAAVRRLRLEDAAFSSPSDARARIINNLPRYKPALNAVPEYYPFGHDVPEPLCDEKLMTQDPDQKVLSLFFGGIGDARNLLATLLQIKARKSKASHIKNYHMTVVDLKPHAIAKILIIMSMLQDISQLRSDNETNATQSGKRKPSQKERELMVGLYYLYTGSIIPPFAYVILEEYIGKVIDMLLNKSPFPSFLEVPEMYRPDMIKALQLWQDGTSIALSLHRCRLELCRLRQKEQQDIIAMSGMPTNIPKCLRKEDSFYTKTGVLVPPRLFDSLLEPKVEKAFTTFQSGRKVEQDVIDHIDTTWKLNVSMIDVEYLKARGPDDQPDLAHNPFEFGNFLYEGGYNKLKPNGLFELVSAWFSHVAEAMEGLKGRYKVEAISGEVTNVLEQIRYGLVGHRSKTRNTDRDGTNKKSEQHDTASGSGSSTIASMVHSSDDTVDTEYPNHYDRIHLSNIPDYIGGSLATFLFALPLVTPGRHSFATSKCLRNPPNFRNIAAFNNEYTALSDLDDLDKIFQARLGKHDTSPFGIPIINYANWHHTSFINQDFKKLMTRPNLETWLYQLFFKLAIPVNRDIDSYTLIFSPFNLTIFLRLCAHLIEVGGYPVHWINQVLSNILSGNIKTSARPPRTNPLKIEEVKTIMPTLTQSTAPFVAELSTLAAIWSTSLPFGLICKSIPSIKMIQKYQVKFKQVPMGFGEVPCFVIVLMHKDGIKLQFKKGLRPLLVDDETGLKTPAASKVRKEGLHIISTWEWERATSSATFWLREDVIYDAKIQKDWIVGIWRSDNWEYQSDPVVVGEVVETDCTWAGR